MLVMYWFQQVSFITVQIAEQFIKSVQSPANKKNQQNILNIVSRYR